MIDTESLLRAISADRPAGVDLEYDPDFLALIEAATGIPERRMGDSVVPAQEPDWRRVEALGTALLGRSKDLRVAVRVARAQLGLNGLAGLRAGLDLIHGLITQFWDGLHPELDASDGNDPTARINVLLELTDRDTLLAQLRTTPLIRSRVFGPVSCREIEIADGKAPALPDTQPLDAAAIGGAFQDCDLEGLGAVTTAADGALATLSALGSDLAARVAGSQTPNLTPLTDLLKQIRGHLRAHLATRQPAGVTPDPTNAGLAASAAAPQVQAGSTPGQIGSRDDVVRTLDRLCDYYARQEPSSPVPLLLKRARRLATGNFLDIMRDLAPDALAQIENVCGSADKP